MSRPILYSFRRCPYAMRARLAIRSSGTEVELREVVLRDKPPAFLEASPSATVPTLVQDDAPVIDESLDIMLWALRRNDPEDWLSPSAGSLDQMLTLVEEIDGPFKTHLDRYKYHVRYVDCDLISERSAASAILCELDKRLEKSGWLFGNRASLADMAILPFVRQFANVDRAWFDGESWNEVSAWLTGFEQSDRFLSIMAKVPQWTEGDPVTIFGATSPQA